METKKNSENPKYPKFIVICGGSASGIGKGITVSSIGVILKACGYSVTIIKIDPYLNIDAGTMNPFEHGECYVLGDGGEVDLDLGNYERFLNVSLTRHHNITTGRVYRSVLDKERRGVFLGKTVQVIPHITDEIIQFIKKACVIPVDETKNTPDFCLIEVGGTVGDIESGAFLEAIRQLQQISGRDNMCLCFLCYVPVLGADKEQKSKPAQHGVKELRFAGLQPDFIFLRSSERVTQTVKQKIALFGSVPYDSIFSVPDLQSVYAVPLELESQQLSKHIFGRLNIEVRPCDLELWERYNKIVIGIKEGSESPCKIAFVGKYAKLKDAYMSVNRALEHASTETATKIDVIYVDSDNLEDETLKADPKKYNEAWDIVRNADGILIPGGFGSRATKGKIDAINYARVNKKPFLGICFGMQLAVIEFCKNVLGIKDASSEEFDPLAENAVIILMEDLDSNYMGGTMRLGLKKCNLKQDSLAHKLYGNCEIYERHRHRYEVNPKYIDAIQAAGLTFSGIDESGKRMEVLELKDHPFYFATQFHPEFNSRLLKASPPFSGFVLASAGKLQRRLETFNGFLCPDINQVHSMRTSLAKTTPVIEPTVKQNRPKLYINFENS